MRLAELNRYLYIREPLTDAFADLSSIGPEYLMDWTKDVHDYTRSHGEEEIAQGEGYTAEQVLDWLEEVATLVWELKYGDSV